MSILRLRLCNLSSGLIIPLWARSEYNGFANFTAQCYLPIRYTFRKHLEADPDI